MVQFQKKVNCIVFKKFKLSSNVEVGEIKNFDFTPISKEIIIFNENFQFEDNFLKIYDESKKRNHVRIFSPNCKCQHIY